MRITANADPAKLPNQSQEQKVFDQFFAEMIAQYPEQAAQMNALYDEMQQLFATMSATAAGGAYSFPYIFDSSTVNADPGVGRLRFNAPNQSAAGVIYVDHQVVGGVNIDSIYAVLAAVTSAVKGSIRIVKQTDPSRWVLYDVTGAVPGSGFRGLPVIYRSGSGGNPFASGDALMVFIERNGDKGDTPVGGATVCLAAVDSISGTGTINYLNLFSADYDRYEIQLLDAAFSTSNVNLHMRLAVAGVAQQGAVYSDMTTGQGPVSGAGTTIPLTPGGVLAQGPSPAFQMEILNANSTVSRKALSGKMHWRGATPNNQAAMGNVVADILPAISGFQIYVSSGTFTGGKLRVWGYRNQAGVI
ncbi:hypothetical protein [Massilia timonae]|uniref:hypothetical protein n=1 Tax=Massilia timonae TaxID=47229 RepID=UPI002353E24A|nr:hypothetical protein [Massilia timonae]